MPKYDAFGREIGEDTLEGLGSGATENAAPESEVAEDGYSGAAAEPVAAEPQPSPLRAEPQAFTSQPEPQPQPRPSAPSSRSRCARRAAAAAAAG